MNLEISTETLFARVEVFECPQCGKKWERAVNEETGLFRQPRVCWAGPTVLDYEREETGENKGCMGLLPCDLEPGDLVSLELWDKTERPSKRIGIAEVVDVFPTRNCQTGFMIEIKRPGGVEPITRLERGWLKRIKKTSGGT